MMLELIFVVLEGKDVFVPSGKLARDSNRDEFSEPNDILDFHFLELEVGVEGTVVEAILKGH